VYFIDKVLVILVIQMVVGKVVVKFVKEDSFVFIKTVIVIGFTKCSIIKMTINFIKGIATTEFIKFITNFITKSNYFPHQKNRYLDYKTLSKTICFSSF